ncbi:MAG: hypothetical protein SPJ77_09495 [Eubacteriales bacterium]|nr:hypothetical protein [Eubacteriales bacterium]
MPGISGCATGLPCFGAAVPKLFLCLAAVTLVNDGGYITACASCYNNKKGAFTL